jgi:hypothetical protein
MKKPTVKYKKDKAVITMPIENYVRLCRHFNVFNQAMNDLGETLDFRLSELNDMDYLRYSLMHNLGFEKSSESYYSDYKIPDKENK